MHELLVMMIKALVDYPEQVVVSKLEGAKNVIFDVKVAPDDLGKVIGKRGRHATALRTLLRAMGMRERKLVFLNLDKQQDAILVED